MMIASILIGCSDDDRPTPPETHVEPTPTSRESTDDGYQVIEEGDELDRLGSIAGSVRWVGDRPEVDELTVDVHSHVCGERQPSRALRIADNNGVLDAVLSLVDIERGVAHEPPTEPVVIAHEGCRFEPHARVVGTGWPLRFVNRDAILHNVRGLSGDDTVLDLGLPEEGAVLERSLSAPGIVRLVDDAGHGWQQGWLHVSEHPYAVVSDENGRFRIERIPPGAYTLRVWHEGWRITGEASGRPRYSAPVILTRQVSVSARQETTVDFELSQQSGEIAGE